MLRKRLSPNDYLLVSAFFGVAIVAVSGGLQDQCARSAGMVLGVVIVVVALGVGIWQGSKRHDETDA